jgi:hypothetical protein
MHLKAFAIDGAVLRTAAHCPLEVETIQLNGWRDFSSMRMVTGDEG